MTQTSDADLRAGLERALAEASAQPGPIARLERRPCPYQTSFTLEELDVELEGGETLELVFKDLARDALSEEARDAKPAFLHDPEREIEAYSRVLSNAGLGTPRFYGAAVEPRLSRYWLFIERVEGVPLWQIGELERWRHVARWLARMHERFLSERAPWEDARHLLRYDADLFRVWPERARDLARRATDEEAPSRLERIEWIAARYEPVVERLGSLQQTFLHGELYASNVLIPETGSEGRVSPIDWEQAAIGPGMIDLAALSAGDWDEEQRASLADAYAGALERPEALGAGPEDITGSLDCCLLHLAMQWLGWAERWRPPREHAHDWLEEATGAAQRLGL